jgi:hypothetical protein
VDFDYLITVCDDADERCPFFPGMGKRLHWGFEDPAAFAGTEEEILAKFREVRDQMDERIRGWLKEVATPAARERSRSRYCEILTLTGLNLTGCPQGCRIYSGVGILLGKL